MAPVTELGGYQADRDERAQLAARIAERTEMQERRRRYVEQLQDLLVRKDDELATLRARYEALGGK